MDKDIQKTKIFNTAYIKRESIDETNFTIDFVMSAQAEDRHGDIVDLATMQIDRYLANNVVLPSHDHNALSVGKVTKIWFTDESGIMEMIGTVKFAVEEYELAKTYWNLYKGGFMNAVSIGFIPHRFENNEEGKTILMECELLELSLVAVPANALALAKSKGVDIDPIVKTSYFLKQVNDTMTEIKELIVFEEKKVEEKPVEQKSNISRLRARDLLNKALRELNKK